VGIKGRAVKRGLARRSVEVVPHVGGQRLRHFGSEVAQAVRAASSPSA
jgi:hypothetical protein